MAEYLRVKKWEDFQHYKDRSPPWIKLHRELLRDYQFSCLQDASKLHLMLIWLLASQLDNKIPNDAAWVQRQIGVADAVDLNTLIDNGFLLLVQDDSGALAGCKQVAMPETETEAETEKEKEHTSESKIPPCPHEEIIEAWHEIMPDKPGITVSLWRDSSSAADLARRWKQAPHHQTVDWWRELFIACREHDFWMNKWDGFNFRWLVKKQNFIKAVEHWETTYRRQHEQA